MNTWFTIVIILGVVGSIGWFLYWRYRSFDDKIEKSLSEHNYSLLNVSPAPLFTKSPFPNFEIYDFHYSTRILGVSGEEVFRRVVKFKNESGETHASWVEITTRAFRFYDIKWEKDLNNLK